MNVTVKQAYEQGLASEGWLRDSRGRLVDSIQKYQLFNKPMTYVIFTEDMGKIAHTETHDTEILLTFEPFPEVKRG